MQQIGALGRGQGDPEPRHVEREDLVERRGESVVKVRGPRRQRAQDRALELADVGPPAASVDTSAFGEFEPSTVRKIGSVPLVASNRAWTPAGVIDQPWSISWQVKHARSLLPSTWKNAPVWMITPAVECVDSVPVASLYW